MKRINFTSANYSHYNRKEKRLYFKKKLDSGILWFYFEFSLKHIKSLFTNPFWILYPQLNTKKDEQYENNV